VVLVDIQVELARCGLAAVGSGDTGAITTLQQRTGRLIARAQTASGPVAVKVAADADAFVAEAAAIRRLAAHGLPVATILHHTPGPPAYLVLSWIEGDALSSATSSPGAQHAVGALLRHVHTIGHTPGQESGRDDPISAGNATWDAWMAGWLNANLTWWADVDPPGEEHVRRVWAWFHDLAPLLATRGHDLILLDGRPEHILVRGDEVAGLIDVAELRTGDAAMDLAVLVVADPALLAGVLEGYRPDAEEQAVFARLVPFYTLLRRISNAEWHQRFGTADELRHALALLAGTKLPA
jgi:aminoglycoside phosphotransferase (APT) family kinase protein